MGAILADGAARWSPAVAAAATIVGALIAAALAARVMSVTQRRLRDQRLIAQIDAGGETRLRVLRRAMIVSIIVVGIFLALLQFDSFDRLASAALASGALLSAIIGFAARESLANLVAGLTIAVSQPIRVGDQIEIGDVRGLVEDLTLTYTWVRTPEHGRIVVPNQLLTTQPLRNDSILVPEQSPTAAVWIAGDADEQAALGALLAIDGARSASVDDVTAAGVRLVVSGTPVPAGARADAAAALRLAALGALRAAEIPRPQTRFQDESA